MTQLNSKIFRHTHPCTAVHVHEWSTHFCIIQCAVPFPFIFIPNDDTKGKSLSGYKGHEFSSNFLNNGTPYLSNVFGIVTFNPIQLTGIIQQIPWTLCQNYIQIIIQHSISSIIFLFEQMDLVMRPKYYCGAACVHSCSVWQIYSTKTE